MRCVPAFARLDSLPSERLGAFALILHYLFGSVDLCFQVLQLFERHTGLPHHRLYMKEIEQCGEIDVSMVTIKTSSD